MLQRQLITLGSKRPLPPNPTRDQVLSYNTHFLGGLLVNSPKYGMMPWWDTCLAWCDSETRQIAYQVKREAKDTHFIIGIPNGKPLYNEWGQFYSPDKFGPLDWTNGMTGLTKDFDNLLYEGLGEGFFFHITMDEDRENSQQIIKWVAQRLKDLGLTKYGFSMPGYDGIFYGWEPTTEIMKWAADARAINPDLLLGLEHNMGHIPLGEGGGDYLPGGRMQDFDIILGEMTPHTNTTWQILGRMIRPYNRPPDQVGDPNPPFYLGTPNPRGSWYYVAFESWNPYNWVRTHMDDPLWVQDAINFVNADRDYFKLCGATFTG